MIDFSDPLVLLGPALIAFGLAMAILAGVPYVALVIVAIIVATEIGMSVSCWIARRRRRRASAQRQ